ncbi:alpha-amylase family glycosyl hydrolase [Mycoplasmopsis felis]|uniref:alpha-amylase family glycosyl hydrolase n=1 Tax=Mycoplasmopsis felis TaxID=33923 RepID=UPI00055B0A03|nr:alpha-amylase family glycosyl hydrolase [Mycoplasmopsis felis]
MKIKKHFTKLINMIPIALSGIIISSCNKNIKSNYEELSEIKTLKDWGDESFNNINRINSLENLTYDDEVAKAEFKAEFNQKFRPSNVMYQLTVYSFADGNGDGIGDFIGLKNNLDYFVNLGIDTLYLSPIHPASSYHGYDVIDYTNIAPELGGMEAFDDFIKEAHSKGIKVVIDMVLNHTSYEHPWFLKALQGDTKYRDYYYFYENDESKGQGVDTNIRKLFKNINIDKYHQNDTKAKYVAQFWSGMPDLNLTNKQVQKEIENIHRFWTKKGVDGFRYDAFYHYFGSENKNKPTDLNNRKTTSLFNSWRKVVEEELNNLKNKGHSVSSDTAFMFGEWWQSVGNSNKYWFTRDFEPALGTVIDGENYKYSLQPFINYDNEVNLINSFSSINGIKRQWLPFLDNHDIDRWIANYKTHKTTTSLDLELHKLTLQERAGYLSALFSLLSRGGMPILYNGNEILMQGGNKSKGDINVREAFYWKDKNKRVYFKEAKSPNDLIQTLTSKGEGYVEDLIANENGSYQIISKLINLRKEYKSLREQDIKYIVNPNDIIDFSQSNITENNITVRKEDENTLILVIYNDSLKQTNIKFKEDYKEINQLISYGYEIKGKEIIGSNDIQLGVYKLIK